MIEGDLYRLSTPVEPFMKTQRENNGYVTSYAQIRVHHGTHVDFPPHVGIDGDPRWNLSGTAAITDLDGFEATLADDYDAVLFDTGGADLDGSVVETLVEGEGVSVVGTDSHRVGDIDVHRRLLDAGVALVENLVNLDDPPASRGYLYCFPTVIEGCDDGAVATVAFEPDGA